jgi:RNA recognition motif-containing protein
LRQLFTDFGDVSSANVIMDKFSGRSRGFGFVEMPDSSAAESAIKALNEKELGGRNLRVNEAKPREERPQRRTRH